MDTRYQRIKKNLTEALKPSVLEIMDESNTHRVPVGAESHFKVTIVASKFIGLSRVARHQLVHHSVQQELTTGLHALSLALVAGPLLSPGDFHHDLSSRNLCSFAALRIGWCVSNLANA